MLSLMWGRGFTVAVLAFGCGPPEMCTIEAGAYQTTFVERTGNCGPIAGQDVVLEADLGPPFSGASSDCSGLVDFTDDNCSVEFDRDCPIYDTDGSFLGTLSFSGVSTIVSATRVEGTSTVYSDGPAEDCSGSYDVTWERR